ncbi:nickel import ATP-binding protein NikD [Malaciobacter mytili LMG 24559]|uniref:Nickel import ATP-binding protein NikD n=1 Tax=Malaciobacter mytili LMG 24559 TaxID=1032238 RepID=A0AAX2AHQ4_9BACT|nr:ABC transporter ATP-binding protein [Malaciobacter mytili]AXH14310.1 nickel ABC transporter, ATP-binding protein [Malaciobacter mytili LMG 24559]RXK16532.1 nickel import ATP-binding protein NikD [Malaciobacter mytili LMG 24559]
MSFLVIKNLNITNKKLLLLENINFELKKGEVLGIIGESGSGKSLLCKTILNLTPSNLNAKGNILLEKQEILNSSCNIRGKKIAVILQEAINAFDPMYKIGAQILESLEEKNKKKAKEIALSWLEKMDIKDSKKVFESYPNELSGGQLQRVMIAIALAQDTPLIIADEPTSSLDVITQRKLLEIFKNLKNKTLIFISHDLALVSKLANKILVIKKGKSIEYNQCETIFNNPQSEYTKHLIKTRKELSQRFLSCLK